MCHRRLVSARDQRLLIIAAPHRGFRVIGIDTVLGLKGVLANDFKDGVSVQSIDVSRISTCDASLANPSSVSLVNARA